LRTTRSTFQSDSKWLQQNWICSSVAARTAEQIGATFEFFMSLGDMGLLKAFFRGLVTLFLVLAGLVMAVCVGCVTAVLLLLGRSRPMRQPAGSTPIDRVRRVPASGRDVIDVTATEVPAEPGKPA
jgi:hypothetical protein